MNPEYYLVLSALLFTMGVAGFLLRRNAIVMFMSVELMLNASNLAIRRPPSEVTSSTGRPTTARGRMAATTSGAPNTLISRPTPSAATADHRCHLGIRRIHPGTDDR